MKIITIVAEQISPEALSAALPTEGVLSVTVDATRTFNHDSAVVQSYRGRKIAQHFREVYRIEVAVEDTAVDAVIDGVAFARGAGLLGDAQAWISAEATELFADAASLVMSS